MYYNNDQILWNSLLTKLALICHLSHEMSAGFVPVEACNSGQIEDILDDGHTT